MAGFFGFFNYNKEGKGVNPEDLDRGAIPTFFGIVGRKFWKIALINIMYVIFSIPALLLAFFGSSFLIQTLFPGLDFNAALGTVQEGTDLLIAQAFEMTLMFFLFGMLLTGLSLIIIGPVHAGIVYVLRNYSREEHSFIWSDFKEHALSNIKQSLASGLIAFVVTIVFVVNLNFYNQAGFIQNELIKTVLTTVIVILFLLFCIMQMYLYPMMVTFELNLKQLYKNSFFFAILKLPMNFLMLILSFIVIFGIPAVLIFINNGITFILAVFWYLFFGFAFNLLMTTFYAYRGLDKYMMKKSDDSESDDFIEDSVEESVDN